VSSSHPLTRIVHLQVASPHRAEFEAYVAQKIRIVAEQAGCLSVQWLRAQDGSYFTYSQWENEDFLEGYRQSATFAEIWATLKAWFDAPARAWSCHHITEHPCSV
jgi:quinol monooxygenase YgiN